MKLAYNAREFANEKNYPFSKFSKKLAKFSQVQKELLEWDENSCKKSASAY